ncbi:MAG: hypothetical protein HONBIEJF_02923 [Fimbriimonadaceae bacterium]|nr:hypothetical protein [Fimbriimonadaceae bacterium]
MSIRTVFLTGLIALLCASASAQVIYSNTQGNLFSSSASPRYALDDVELSEDHYWEIDKIKVGYVVAGTGDAADFDILVRYWDEVDYFPFGSLVSLPINRGFLGSAVIQVRGAENGIYTTDWQDIKNIKTFDGRVGVEFSFWNPGTAVTHGNATLTQAEMANFNRRATHLFAGGPVEIGSSADVYWRDADNNGQFDPSDQRNFGGWPNYANFYHAIEAVPEPTTVMALLAGIAFSFKRPRHR